MGESLSVFALRFVVFELLNTDENTQGAKIQHVLFGQDKTVQTLTVISVLD